MNLQDLTDDQKVGLLEQVMKKTQKYQKEYYQNVTKMKQHWLAPIRKKKLPPPWTFYVPFFWLAQVCKLWKEWMRVVMDRFYNQYKM